MGSRESTTKIRLDFHRKAEELFDNKDKMDPQILFDRTQKLKIDIEQFSPWEGCSRFFCPLNPYFAYHEITARIRETNVVARARLERFGAQRSSEIREGVRKGEAQAERLRGSGSKVEQIAAQAVLGPITGLLVTSATGREIARETPQAIKERAGELASGNLCTTEQVSIPLIGKLTCPGGVGCGWPCYYEKHRTAFLILGAVVGLGVAAIVLNPYAKIVQKVIGR